MSPVAATKTIKSTATSGNDFHMGPNGARPGLNFEYEEHGPVPNQDPEVAVQRAHAQQMSQRDQAIAGLSNDLTTAQRERDEQALKVQQLQQQIDVQNEAIRVASENEKFAQQALAAAQSQSGTPKNPKDK